MDSINNWALLYYPAGGAAFPCTPDHFMARVPEQRIMCLATEAGIQAEVSNIATVQELQDGLVTLLYHPAVNWAGKLYTVHTGGMFERLLHWRNLRLALENKPSSPLRVPAVVDIAEAFHGRSIMTYEQRKNFCVNDMIKWLGMGTLTFENKAELEALIRICQIL